MKPDNEIRKFPGCIMWVVIGVAIFILGCTNEVPVLETRKDFIDRMYIVQLTKYESYLRKYSSESQELNIKGMKIYLDSMKMVSYAMGELIKEKKKL